MNTQRVKDTLDAINSVKGRAKAALTRGDYILLSQLMGDLYALEACLVGETERLVEEIDKEAA
jgi:hypothetical protein